MPDIGDGHQQAPAGLRFVSQRFAIHRVVKITRVFAVYGDKGHIGQIHSVLRVLGSDLVRQAFSLFQTGLGKPMRHAVFAHRNFNLHAGVVHLAQHFLHTPHRLTVQTWRLCQLDHHHLTDQRFTGGGFGNQYVLTVTPVFGRDQPDTAFLQQASDDGMRRSFSDFKNAAFGSALFIGACDTCNHAVAMQHGAHLVRR